MRLLMESLRVWLSRTLHDHESRYVLWWICLMREQYLMLYVSFAFDEETEYSKNTIENMNFNATLTLPPSWPALLERAADFEASHGYSEQTSYPSPHLRQVQL